MAKEGKGTGKEAGHKSHRERERMVYGSRSPLSILHH